MCVCRVCCVCVVCVVCVCVCVCVCSSPKLAVCECTCLLNFFFRFLLYRLLAKKGLSVDDDVEVGLQRGGKKAERQRTRKQGEEFTFHPKKKSVVFLSHDN